MSTTYNAANDLSNTNPSGAWAYGKGAAGRDFVAYLQKDFYSGGVQAWKDTSVDIWRSVIKNVTTIPQNLYGEVFLAPGRLMMYPGYIPGDTLTKIRFTAPQDGIYAVDVKWTPMDAQARKTQASVYSSAGVGASANFAQLFTGTIDGYSSSASFTGSSITLQKGDVLSFEVGNGDDGSVSDALQVDLTITCAPQVTYEIGKAALVNLAGVIGCGTNYACKDNNKYGFNFTDSRSATGNTVVVELNYGIESTGIQTFYLNGTKGTHGPLKIQTCPNIVPVVVLVTFPATALVKGGVNAFLGSSAGGRHGFSPKAEWGGAFARVIVR